MQGEKRPAIEAWQRFADRMPTAEEQALWLDYYADCNIGLPLGPCSGLVALDIDSLDTKVVAAIEAVLPSSPWERVGAKGKVKIYKWADHRTVRIRDENEKTICEILSRGTQIVIPPSIHPDTQKPYWANSELVKVLASIGILPKDAEILIRGALDDIGIHVSRRAKLGVTQFVPSGFRDNALVSMAGVYAMSVSRGERTLVDALGQMKAWVENFTEKVIGDDVTVEKAQQKLIEFLISDVMGEKRKTLPSGWDAGLDDKDKKALGLDFDETQEQWNYNRIRAKLDELISESQDINSPSFKNSVEFLLGRIAHSESVNTMEVAELLQTISAVSNKRYGVVALRSRIKELQAAAIEGANHTEIANALLKEISQGSEVRGEGGRFYRYNGAFWDVIEDEAVKKLIADCFGGLPAARKQSDHNGIMKVLYTLVQRPLKELQVHGLNFANGFLTSDLELREHNADYGATYMFPCRYIPEIWDRCPMWTTFLYDAWGQDEDYAEKVMALQEAMAATLFGLAPRYQRAFCCWGVSDSGKSRIISLMSKLMPPGTKSAVNPSDWKDKFLPAELHGKLLNIAGEISGTKKIEGRSFKTIVCGEEMQAQRKNQQPFTFQPICAHWFASNHIPTADDADSGFSRRWLFFTFPRKIPKEKQVEDYEDVMLDAEREEIVSWAAHGIIRLMSQRGYTMPPSSKEKEEQVNQRINNVHHFLKACQRILVGRARHEGRPKKEVLQTTLYNEYQCFLHSGAAARPVTLTKFRELMEQLQGDFDFRQTTRVSPSGNEEIAYEFITLAPAKAV